MSLYLSCGVMIVFFSLCYVVGWLSLSVGGGLRFRCLLWYVSRGTCFGIQILSLGITLGGVPRGTVWLEFVLLFCIARYSGCVGS